MTTLAMLLLVGQETPGEALKKFVESIEKKDYDLYLQACGEKMTKKVEKEEFLGQIEKSEKKMAGHFVEAMKKGPTLGTVGEGASKIELRWKYPVAEGLVNVRVKLMKTDAGWKVNDFNPRLDEKGETKGASGKAASSPAQVLQSFVTAIEKKEYGKIPEFFFGAKEATAEEIEKEFAKEESKSGGHWLDGLKRAAAVEGGDEALTEIEFGIEFDLADGRIEVGLKYVKGKVDWQLRDLDSDFKKAK